MSYNGRQQPSVLTRFLHPIACSRECRCPKGQSDTILILLNTQSTHFGPISGAPDHPYVQPPEECGLSQW